MDKSRVEPTIFFIEKISFSLKPFSGHFYGQSFIKTVRGPLFVWSNNRNTFFGSCSWRSMAAIYNLQKRVHIFSIFYAMSQLDSKVSLAGKA